MAPNIFINWIGVMLALIGTLSRILRHISCGSLLNMASTMPYSGKLIGSSDANWRTDAFIWANRWGNVGSSVFDRFNILLWRVVFDGGWVVICKVWTVPVDSPQPWLECPSDISVQGSWDKSSVVEIWILGLVMFWSLLERKIGSKIPGNVQ